MQRNRDKKSVFVTKNQSSQNQTYVNIRKGWILTFDQRMTWITTMQQQQQYLLIYVKMSWNGWIN